VPAAVVHITKLTAVNEPNTCHHLRKRPVACVYTRVRAVVLQAVVVPWCPCKSGWFRLCGHIADGRPGRMVAHGAVRARFRHRHGIMPRGFRRPDTTHASGTASVASASQPGNEGTAAGDGPAS
jgi:hypothetical protein